MQCLLLETSVENNSNTELEPEELEEILSKLKESVQSDIRQAAVWNTLGVILLQSGRLQVELTICYGYSSVAVSYLFSTKFFGDYNML